MEKRANDRGAGKGGHGVLRRVGALGPPCLTAIIRPLELASIMIVRNEIAVVAIAMLACSCSPPAPTGDFDLVAASVTWRPNPVHVGDKVVLDHVVRNDGTNTVRAGTYFVDLYLDGQSVAFDHATSDILPGGAVPYSMAAGYYTWQPTKGGRFHYRFVVDERNTLRERTKTNNVLEGDIDVLP